MEEVKGTIKTFDPEEIKRVIEVPMKSGLLELRGEIRFELDQNFGILEVRTEKALLSGEWKEDQPPGFFLLFSRNDLVELVKDSFGLRDVVE